MEQIVCSRNAQYVHCIEGILWDSLQPHNPAWLDDSDKLALKWAWSIWYLVWCDFARPFLGTDHQLLERRTVIRWAKQISEIDIVEQLVTFDQLDEQIRHSSLDTIVDTMASVLAVLPAPCSRQVQVSFLARYSFPSSEFARLENPVLQHLRTLLCLIGRIDLSQQVKDALEVWQERERIIQTDYRLDWRLVAAKTRHPWPKLDLNLISSKLSHGSVADHPGLRSRTYRKCDTEVSISRRVALTAARFGLRSPNARELGSPSGKLILVPKSYKTRRVIVAEPLTAAWLQASTQRALQRATAVRWGKSCDPTDPIWNREAVQLYPDKYCTIDLSEASDSVSCAHVVAVSSPEVRRLVFGARTPDVLMPDGTRHSLAKFAGMGNGHTFCMEINVFASCVSTVADDAPKEGRHFGVFGDDIVVHNCIFDATCERLSEMGFTINESKSFGPHSSFKESCGVDVFDRAVVTPIRLPRSWRSNCITVGSLPPSHNGKSAVVEALTALVSLACEIAEFPQYAATKRYIYDNLRRRGARFSNEPSVEWDDKAARYFHTVLHSPTADGVCRTSFGREPKLTFYPGIPGTKLDRHDGHFRFCGGHYGLPPLVNRAPHGTRQLTNASLQWALSSPEGDFGTAYPWLYQGQPLPIRE